MTRGMTREMRIAYALRVQAEGWRRFWFWQIFDAWSMAARPFGPPTGTIAVTACGFRLLECEANAEELLEPVHAEEPDDS